MAAVGPYIIGIVVCRFYIALEPNLAIQIKEERKTLRMQQGGDLLDILVLPREPTTRSSRS